MLSILSVTSRLFETAVVSLIFLAFS